MVRKTVKDFARWVEHIVVRLLNPFIVSAFMVPGAGLFHKLWVKYNLTKRVTDDSPEELWNKYGDKLRKQWYVMLQNVLGVDTETCTFSVPAYWRLTFKHRPPSGKFWFHPYKTHEEMEILHDAYVQMMADEKRFEHAVLVATLALAGSVYGRNNISRIAVTGAPDDSSIKDLRRNIRAEYPLMKRGKLKEAILRNIMWRSRFLEVKI